MKHDFGLFLIIGIFISGIAMANIGTGVSSTGYLTSVPPGVPTLITPNEELTPLNYTLDWHSQIHTASYQLQVSQDENFSSFVQNEMIADTSYTLHALQSNTSYYWRVSATNVAGSSVFSEVRYFTTMFFDAVDETNDLTPKTYALFPAYPNPLNPSTVFTYNLPEKAEVQLVIYNSKGQFVRQLTSGTMTVGSHSVQWDGRDNDGLSVVSGLYFCSMKANNHIFTQKLLLLK